MNNSKPRVAVIGATGYAGAELVRILAGHPGIELACVTSRQYAGIRFDDIYPSMAGHVDLICEPYDAEKLCKSVDLVFTALPHKLPMEIVPDLVKSGIKVVDLSADFRFKDPGAYESAYQPHAAPHLLEKATYGLSEVFADQIKKAVLVGNPGCYPTCSLLPLVPLLQEKLIDPGFIIIDAKSGVSGAGRSPSLATLYCEINESFRAYKVACHRHEPEMEAVLSDIAGFSVDITFVPHLTPMNRGMVATIYTRTAPNKSVEDVVDTLSRFCANHPFLRFTSDTPPDARNVRGTNFCDIGVTSDHEGKRIILMSAIDNLVKGASGQAVQNMNLMLGFPESTGLWSVPYPV